MIAVCEFTPSGSHHRIFVRHSKRSSELRLMATSKSAFLVAIRQHATNYSSIFVTGPAGRNHSLRLAALTLLLVSWIPCFLVLLASNLTSLRRHD